MKTFFNYIFVVILGLLFISGLSLISGLVFMLAWNEVAPSIFKLPGMSYLQAFCFILMMGVIGSMFKSELNINKN